MYDYKDVMQITGRSRNNCYELIRHLQDELKKEKPEVFVLRGRIPKDYFNKKLGIKED